MTNQQILEKAIAKAIEGGYRTEVDYKNVGNLLEEYALGCMYNPNHDFAKALWGDMKWKSIGTPHIADKKSGWQYHLQQMVIADDPIKYLGENI